MKSKTLKPYRLTTNITFSKSLLNESTQEFEEYITELLRNAIYDKLVQTILSDSAETEDRPAGIFNGVEVTNITSYNDLCQMQYEGDRNQVDNAFIISPKAKYEINKLSDNLLHDNQLLNNPAICENLMQDGFICYMPLDLLLIAEFGTTSITVDAISKAADNEVVVYIDSYLDFGYLNKDLIKLAKFA
ncbi:MAG: phage major capsid protein [Bacteroidaceae bacterium]|nr:phage major capsid protein [Bacteroidaceae bacterium]